MISVKRSISPPNSFNTIATTSVLGLVKVGTGLSISLDGTLTVTNPTYTHPTQTPINTTTTGLEFISEITVNGLGHTTSVKKRSITVGNLSSSDIDVVGGTSSVFGTGTSLSLKSIQDTGVGSFKKITRNSKGLLVGTQDVSWNDLSSLGAIRLSSISENITGIEYNNLTGVFSLTTDYFIPTLTQKSNWDTAFSWGDHSTRGYATESFVTTKISELIGGAGSAYDTLLEIQNILQSEGSSITSLFTSLGTKVDKSTSITINGTTFDLSTNRTWSVGTVTSITAGNGLSGGAITGVGTISLQNLGSNGSYNNVTVDSYGRVTGGSLVSYLTSESDPVFVASAAYNISTTQISHWDTAYSNTHSALSLGTNQNGLSLAGQVLSLAVATTTTSGAMSSPDKSKLDGLSNYSLPTATNSVLGGVKIGSNITITGGTISVAAPYVHPTTDGSLHVPATGTTSLGKILGAGATAGVFGWYTLQELGIQPVGNYLTTLPSHTITSHSDVVSGTLVNKNVLYYNGTNWINKTLTLSDISDYSLVNVNYWTKTGNNLGYTAGRILLGTGADDTLSQLQVFGDIKLSGVLTGTTGNFTSLTLSSFLQSSEIRVTNRISLGGNYATVGQVIKSNGTNEYWGTLSYTDITNFDSRVNTLITSSQSSTNYWTKNNTTNTLSYTNRVLIGTSTDDLSSTLQIGGSIKQGVLSKLLMSNSSGVIVAADNTSVITALGFTPYNSTNPSGYISSLPSHSIGTHTDVTLVTTINKQVLVYNGTTSRFENRVLLLSDISDYSVSGVNYWTKTGTTLSYSSGRVLVGSGTDDTSNQLQVFGTTKLNGAVTGTTGSFTSLTISSFIQSAEVRVTSRLTFGANVYGTVGQVVKSNGTVEYWGTLDSTDITNFDSRVNTLITLAQSGTNYWTRNNTTSTLSYLNRVLIGTSTDDLSSMLQVGGTIKQSVLSSLLMSNSSGVITSADSSSVIAALGFTPYNSTNPNGYISSLPSHSISGHSDVTITTATNKNVLYYNGTVWVNRTLTLSDISDYSISGTNYWTKTGTTLSYSGGRVLVGSVTDDTTTQFQVGGSIRQGVLSKLLMSNSSGVIVAADSNSVITALGYTPYNSTNPNNYLTTNQSITLSGDVSGTGTTTIVTTVNKANVNYWTKIAGNHIYYNAGRVIVGATSSSGDYNFEVAGNSKFLGNSITFQHADFYVRDEDTLRLYVGENIQTYGALSNSLLAGTDTLLKTVNGVITRATTTDITSLLGTGVGYLKGNGTSITYDDREFVDLSTDQDFIYGNKTFYGALQIFGADRSITYSGYVQTSPNAVELGLRFKNATGFVSLDYNTFAAISNGSNIKYLFKDSGLRIGDNLKFTLNPTERLEVDGSIKQSGFASQLVYANSGGKLVAATAANVATLLGTAAAGNYIQNQNAAQQTANYWISGNGKIGGKLTGVNIDLIQESAFGYGGGGYRTVRIGGTSISLADVSTVIGGNFRGSNEVIIPNDFIFTQVNSTGTDFLNGLMSFVNGKIAIGAISTTEMLNVAGSVRIDNSYSFRFGAGFQYITNDNTINSLIFGSNGGQNMVLRNGNVGINTTTPINKLDVLGSSHTTLGGRNVFGDDGNYNPFFRQYRWTGGGVNYYSSSITTTGDDTGGVPALNIKVATNGAAIGAESYANIITFIGDGRAIVGNTSGYVSNAVAKLQVNGGILQKNIISKMVYANADGTLVEATAANIATTLGAGNYIQNQFTAGQSANFWISGQARIDGYFHVNSSVPTIQISRGGTAKAYIGVAEAANSFATGTAMDDVILRTQGGALHFVTNGGGSSAMYINSAQNVGIGTTTPSDRLTLDGGNQGIKSGGYLKLYHSANSNWSSIYSPASGVFAINTGGVTNVLYIENGGNVGIGTTGPAYHLHVYGIGEQVIMAQSPNGAAKLVLSGTFGQIYNGSGDFYISNAGANIILQTNSLERARITGTGRFLVGTTSEINTYKMQIDSGTASGLGLYVRGTILATDNVESYSDLSIKSNLKQISLKDAINGISIYSYNKYGKKRIGAIAQDIQKYFPEIVGKSNGLLTVDNYGFSALAFQAGKQAYNLAMSASRKADRNAGKIAELEKEVATLKKQLARYASN